MQDKSALLHQLRIDRPPDEPTPGGRRWPAWLLAGFILVVLMGALALWVREGRAPLVDVATARAAATSTGGGPAAGASILDASGYIVARREATVSSKVTGKVAEVRIEEGQRVRQGDIIALIDDSNARADLALAQAQLESAGAQLEQIRVELAEAERQLRRNQGLAPQHLIPQSTLDQSQSDVDSLKAQLAAGEQEVRVSEANLAVRQRNLDDTVVRAPFDGVITVKNAQPGEMISPLSAGGDGTRTGIGTLVDMSSLEIEVDVSENFINRVKADQPAVAHLNAYPEWDIASHVIAVVPTADRNKATVKVRLALDDIDDRVLPDMGVRVSFLNEPAPTTNSPAQPTASVLIPAQAVRKDGDRSLVWLVRDGHVERRAVATGPRQGNDIGVISGLSSGDQVALSGFEALSDGAAVRIRKS